MKLSERLIANSPSWIKVTIMKEMGFAEVLCQIVVDDKG